MFNQVISLIIELGISDFKSFSKDCVTNKFIKKIVLCFTDLCTIVEALLNRHVVRLENIYITQK